MANHGFGQDSSPMKGMVRYSSSVHYKWVMMMPGAVLSGVLVFAFLNHLFIPTLYSIYASMSLAATVFGISIFYLKNPIIATRTHTPVVDHKTIFILLLTYAVCLVVVSIIPPYSTSDQFYSPWNLFSWENIIRLAGSLLLIFFLPGFSLISIALRSIENSLLKVLLGYLISIAIAGISAYILGLLAVPISSTNQLMVMLYTLLLAICGLWYMIRNFQRKPELRGYSDFKFKLRVYSPLLLTFAGLFSFLVLITYMLYDGIIIGDQWFHHGRALLFLGGDFYNLSVSGQDVFYPPFLPALLSVFFSISGIPSVNAYASISFLNFIPVIAFYYLFKRWVPFPHNKAALISTVLFMTSSGLGWAVLLYIENPNLDESSSFLLLNDAGIRSFDIRLPGTFIGVGHPDISTGLILIGLPAGFVLLGLIKERMKNLTVFIIVTVISTVASLTHDEYHLFIIISSLAPIIFRVPKVDSIYLGNIVSICIIFAVELISPGEYYSIREVLGTKLLYLVFIFVITSYFLYKKQLLQKAVDKTKEIRWPKQLRQRDSPFLLLLKIFIVGIVVYLYLLTFLVWDRLPQEDLFQTTLNVGQRNIPWFMYPMKVGITGLLGFGYILLSMFKPVDRSIFIFGLLAGTALLLGPFYDEHRFSKYLLGGLAAFAGALIYQVIQQIRKIRLALPIGSLFVSLVVVCASLSVVLYGGYTALGMDHSDSEEFSRALPRRTFPSGPELDMLNFLRTQVNASVDNIAVPVSETVPNHGLIARIEAFTGISQERILQSPLVLGASSTSALFELLSSKNIHLIVVPKNTIQGSISETLNFVTTHFTKIYDDGYYLILKVPHFNPPSTYADISVVLPNNQSLIANEQIVNLTTPPDSKDFGLEGSTIVLRQSPSQNFIWSQPLQSKINYVAGTMKILGSYKTDDSHAGILWKDGEGTNWYAFIRNNKLSLFNSIEKEFLQRTVNVNLTDWNSLKIIFGNSSIDIYLNDVLTLRTKHNISGDNLSQIGISNLNNLAEFEPLVVGNFSENQLPSEWRLKDEFYPISMVAFSNHSYKSFTEDDLSFLSNPIVVSSSNIGERTIEALKRFVGNGGQLVLFNSQMNAKENLSVFENNLFGNKNPLNSMVSEKSYGSGRIYEIDALRFFDLLNRSELTYQQLGQFFNNLVNKPLIDQKQDIVSEPLMKESRFIGKMYLKGKTIMNTTSISFPQTRLHAQDFAIEYENGTRQHFKNLSINQIIFSGNYRGSISTESANYLPRWHEFGYTDFGFSNGLNLNGELLPTSSIEIMLENDSRISVVNDARFSFNDIKKSHGNHGEELRLILKQPWLRSLGYLSFEDLYSNDPRDIAKPLAEGGKTDFAGDISFIINHNDVYLNDEGMYFVTYLNWWNFSGTSTVEKSVSLIPGDVSEYSKTKRIDIPINEAIYSESGLKLLVIIPITIAVIAFLYAPKRRTIRK